MKTLYPEIEPYSFHQIRVGQHHIHVEECGNPVGIPVIFLHGGPGSGCKPHHRQFFDPEKYRVILFDQRGCGRSLPRGELRDNTTHDLLADMERIRHQLDIERWLLFGGSWGAALALLYAEAHPHRVTGMILRGTFLARDCDLHWYAGGGAHRIYPEQWQEFTSVLEPGEENDLIAAYRNKLHAADEVTMRRAARNWEQWGATVTLGAEAAASRQQELHASASLLDQVRLELHYAQNHYFIASGQILADLDKVPDVPVVIIHGRRDLVCPLEAAFTLHQKLPHAEFTVLENAGHIAAGDEMVNALVDATDRLSRMLA